MENNFPVLITERLLLVELLPAHASDLHKIYSDEETMRYFDCDAHTDIAQTQKLIRVFNERWEKNQGLRWGICLTGSRSGELIGSMGFNSYAENGVGIIGYDLRKDYWNKGLATEALTAVVRYGFESLLIHRAEAIVDPDNTGSERVLEKCGFTREGVLRERYFFKGRYQTVTLFAKLSTD
ncbi:MAG: hypothetical protein FD123_698 [Bacteroidetes bacterium]|nr:MAG: hypothetical protein FD123_698 [Bacteroidota bacterium]